MTTRVSTIGLFALFTALGCSDWPTAPSVAPVDGAVRDTGADLDGADVVDAPITDASASDAGDAHASVSDADDVGAPDAQDGSSADVVIERDAAMLPSGDAATMGDAGVMAVDVPVRMGIVLRRGGIGTVAGAVQQGASMRVFDVGFEYGERRCGMSATGQLCYTGGIVP